MKPGTSADSARRFLKLRRGRRGISLDAWTYDALVRIAQVRQVAIETVLEEMLEDWKPSVHNANRARRRPR